MKHSSRKQTNQCISKALVKKIVQNPGSTAPTKGRAILYKLEWYRREAGYDCKIFPAHVSAIFKNSIPNHLKGQNLAYPTLRAGFE